MVFPPKHYCSNKKESVLKEAAEKYTAVCQCCEARGCRGVLVGKAKGKERSFESDDKMQYSSPCHCSESTECIWSLLKDG